MDPGPGKPLELSLMIPSVNQLFSLTIICTEQGLSLSECSHNLTAPLAPGESPWAETVGPGATVTGSLTLQARHTPSPPPPPPDETQGLLPEDSVRGNNDLELFLHCSSDVSSGPVPHSTRGVADLGPHVSCSG